MTGCNYPQTRYSAVEKQEKRQAVENVCAVVRKNAFELMGLFESVCGRL